MSLFEVLVTLGLFLSFLVAAGGLVIKASRVLRFSAGKADSLRALTVALDRMVRDVAGAQQVLVPAGVGSAGSLAIVVVDPASLERLYPPSAPNFPIMQLNVAPHMMEIRYQVTDERLQRQALRGGSPVSLAHVAERVQSLECNRRADDLMELRIQAIEEQRVRTVSTAVPLLVGVP